MNAYNSLLHLHIHDEYENADKIIKAAEMLNIGLEGVLKYYQGTYKSMYDYAKAIVKHGEYFDWRHNKLICDTVDYDLLVKKLKTRFDIVFIDGLGYVFIKEGKEGKTA